MHVRGVHSSARFSGLLIQACPVQESSKAPLLSPEAGLRFKIHFFDLEKSGLPQNDQLDGLVLLSRGYSQKLDVIAITDPWVEYQTKLLRSGGTFDAVETRKAYPFCNYNQRLALFLAMLFRAGKEEDFLKHCFLNTLGKDETILKQPGLFHERGTWKKAMIRDTIAIHGDDRAHNIESKIVAWLTGKPFKNLHQYILQMLLSDTTSFRLKRVGEIFSIDKPILDRDAACYISPDIRKLKGITPQKIQSLASFFNKPTNRAAS